MEILGKQTLIKIQQSESTVGWRSVDFAMLRHNRNQPRDGGSNNKPHMIERH